MRWLAGAVIALAASYMGVAALLYVMQRHLIYRSDAAVAIVPGTLPGVVRRQITTADRQTLNAWYIAPQAGKPLLLFLHGNGGNLATLGERFAQLTAQGNGLLAIDWRGYGGSTGSPTEDGLMLDADAAYAAALAAAGTGKRIFIIGESLGSGPAIALAARLECAGLILDAPYSSVVDVAAARFWMFPVRLLIADRYRSDLRVKDIKAPLLIVHGDQDRTIPIRFGEKLFALAPEPKQFIKVAGGGHPVMGADGVMPQVLAWIDRLPVP
jgi:pimeloyl-ACP methyl ester carboxylesterase